MLVIDLDGAMLGLDARSEETAETTDGLLAAGWLRLWATLPLWLSPNPDDSLVIEEAPEVEDLEPEESVGVSPGF